MSFDTAIYQWRAGERRLAEAEPPERVAMERVTSRIHAELRRRLGGAFTVDELVELYDRGTGWCLDLAYAVAPGAPWAWDDAHGGRRRLRPLRARGGRLRRRATAGARPLGLIAISVT